MKKLTLILIIPMLLACQQGKKNPETAPAAEEKTAPSWALELLWKSDTLMRTCESVLFDGEGEQLIVSCINGAPWEKDGQGFMGLLNLDGSVKASPWVEGLNAPKGSGLYEGILYVADMDQVVLIDMERAEIIEKIDLLGAEQLNDITVDTDGTVYITDSNTGWIWSLKDGNPEPWIEGDFARPNGLLVEPERMFLATSQSQELMLIDRESKEAKTIVPGIGHGDGIAFTGKEGHYLVSSWMGEVFLILPDLSKLSLLKTEAEGINSADIDFNQDEQILYVPTFFDNRVVAYKLVH